MEHSTIFIYYSLTIMTQRVITIARICLESKYLHFTIKYDRVG